MLCGICFDVKKEYIRFETGGKCNHIFCKECTVDLTNCPCCREEIKKIVNIHF